MRKEQKKTKSNSQPVANDNFRVAEWLDRAEEELLKLGSQSKTSYR